MGKFKAALATACVIAATAAAFSPVPYSAGQVESPTASQCTPYKVLYAHKRWRDKHPLAGENPCELGGRKRAALRLEFYTYQRYRQVAKLPGLHEGDPYLEWLPLPAYVVRCETRGRYGRSRWTASNTAGALGPAQVLSSWHPRWPVEDNQDKLAYWEKVDWLRNTVHTHWDCG